jgi:hypothetical protein
MITRGREVSGGVMKRNSRYKSIFLKVDEDFVPSAIEGGDEYYPNGIFVFNITKMLGFINDNKDKIKIKNISVKEYRKAYFILNEDYIGKVDLKNPVILAEISPGRHNIIDGHHRVEKAYRSGIETIPAYILTPYQHMPFLTDTEAYHSYVVYWNGKVKEMQDDLNIS